MSNNHEFNRDIMSPHLPVLLQEVVQYSHLNAHFTIVDATIGYGGHAEALLMHSPQGRLLGIDQDQKALSFAGERLSKFGSRVTLVQGQFSSVLELSREHHFVPADLVLFDLGVSSPQLDQTESEISFNGKGSLDMRMRPGLMVMAADIINTWSPDKLRHLFTEHGQVATNRLVSRIVVERKEEPIATIERLVSIVAEVVPKVGRLHPATAIFQALRVEVNQEMNELRQGLIAALSLLRTGGRLIVISFHSGEDRIVKKIFQQEAKGCVCSSQTFVCECGHEPRVQLVTKHPLQPTEAEVKQNPRSRSAKMRVVEKIGIVESGMMNEE